MSFNTPARSRRPSTRSRRTALAAAAVAMQLFALIPAGPVLAADATLVTTDFTAPNLVGDSNVSAQPSQGPNSFLISVDYCNTGTTHAVTDVVAYIGNGTTPGTFPIVTPPPGTTAYSGNFQIQIVNGAGNDATRYLGTLAAGECQMVNWIVQYAVLDSLNRPVFGITNNIADDLVYRWNWWGSGIDAGDASIVTVSGSDTGTVRSEISANANKIQPNGGSTTISPSATVQIGQQLTVTFNNVDFGSAQQGFDSDGDGDFDYDLWFQPIGESTLWNPNAFRLADVEGTVTAKCGGNTFLIPVSDYTYLSGLDSYGGNCTFTGTYTYTFVAIGIGTATMSPYQEVASGSNNEKYNGDYCGDNPTASPNICVFLTSTNGGSPTIDKTVDKAYASVGENLTYSLTYTNISSLPQGGVAAPVVMVDAIPAGTSYVAGSATCPVGVDCTADFSTNGGVSYQATEPADPATVTHVRFLIFDAVPAGGSGTATFRVRVNSGSGTLTNTASIGILGGSILATDSASTCIECADISLAKSVSPTTSAEGATIRYTVTVSNAAAGVPATGVVVRDLLPAGLTYVSSSTTNGSYNSGNGSWTLANPVAAGGSSSLTIDATINAGTAGSTITNVAEVIAQNQIDSDSTPNNGIITEDDYATAILTVTGADLSIVKTDAIDHVAIGQNIVYTLAVANLGPDTAVGVQVLDTLPAGATLVSAVPSTGTCTPASGSVTCSLGNLASGAAATVTVTIRMSVAGTVTNTARVSSSTPDPNPNNDEDSEDTLVGFAPVVNIVKSGPASALIGQLVTYGFAVTNTTPAGDGSPISAVSVVDDVAGAATYLSGDANSNGLLEVGETWLYSATHTVTISDPDPLVNTATVTGTDRDGETVSDTDTHSLDRITPGSIGDRVWEDLDGDGIQDGGEPGIDGVTVTLYAADGTTVVSSTVTAGGGLYQFSGLAPATYVVGFTAPGGYVVTVADAGSNDALDSDPSPVTAKTGPVVVNETSTSAVDAGLYRPVSIGDRVWEDLDGDGIQDVGEPGIDGVTVTLYAADGTTVVSSTVTAGGGLYQFSGLAPATYVVGFTAPSGYVVTVADAGSNDALDSDPNPATSKTAAVVTTSGDAITSVDAGLYRPVSIGDFVWLDLDGDGIQDGGEPGLAGATVTLSGTDGTGATVNLVTASAISGSYGFSGLVPGTYQLTFVLPGGLLFSPQDAGSDDALDSDPDSSGVIAGLTLASGAAVDSADAGALPAVIGDRVWEDLDGDGIQDAGEPGIAGVTVTLYAADGTTVLDTDTTDGSGSYQFLVIPGDYVVGFAAPGGHQFTASGAGSDDALDSDADATGSTGLIAVAGPSGTSAIDAGLYQPVLLGDRVWEDSNGNGLQDGSETGIEGATVTLYRSDGATLVATTTTNGSGNYSFTGLTPGSYVVEFDVSTATIPGLTLTTQDAGGDVIDSDPDPVTGRLAVTLTSGVDVVSVDAGAFVAASIGDRLFFDVDGDGTDDPGEPGLPAVTVDLLDGFGAVVDTTVTDASGGYLFSAVEPGSYTVRVVFGSLPSGIDVPTADPDGGADGEAAATVTSGVDIDTVDFGFTGSASIGDLVWFDVDGDGVQDLGEPGVSAIAVTLTWAGFDNVLGNADDLTYSSSTDVAGAYSIGLLPAGSFEVSAATPGFGITAPTYDSDGGADASALLSLVTGATDLGQDFGFTGAGSIGDLVFEDLDGDGVAEPGEPGIGGVTVNLTWLGVDGLASTGDEQVYSTVTGADGSYLFSGLPAGTFFVDPTTPAGYLLSTGNDPLTLTIAAAGSDMSADFGYLRTTTLGDRVWIDLDADGIQDAGEPGLSGVTVTLYAGDGTTILSTTATDGSGGYAFSGVLPGDYIIGFGTTGWSFTTQDAGADDLADSDAASNGLTALVTVVSGVNDASIDAGVLPAVLGDRVFIDENGNGIQDPAEPGLPGVTVELLDDSTGATLATTVTDGSGLYAFPVQPGAYRVAFTPLSGYVFTAADLGADDAVDSDADPFSGETGSVVITDGAGRDDLDAGLYVPVSLGDRVFLDDNGNGIDDGEPGVEGATVRVTGAGPNGLFGDGDDTTVLATTTATGGWQVDGLAPGAYRVTFDLSTATTAGLVFTTPNVGVDDTIDSDPVAGVVTGLTLTSGGTDDTVDAGAYVPVVVFGSVLEDLAANGIQELGDTGLAGITVELLDGSGAVVATTTTVAGGGYRFEDLAPGTYSVRVDATGYLVSPQDQGGDNSIDSDIDSLGVSDPVTLASGESADIDGLLSRSAIISDLVWVDLDSDGVQDAGEPGLPGVTVSLYADADSDGAPDGPALDSAVTDGAGGYSFVVTPGDYLLGFSATDFLFTLQDQGGNDSIDSDVDPSGLSSTITAISGQNDTSVDAGVLPATIGDRVWEDVDGDGVQDPGEPGVDAVSVDLYAADGTTLLDSTVTDAAGLYSFSVAPGDYVVEFVAPAGMAFALVDQGGDDAADSDAGSVDGRVSVTSSGSLANTTVDAGLVAPAAIGDLAWNDLDADGIQDASEPGLAGVLVNLYGSDGTTLVASAITAAGGAYSFTGLAPGAYVIEFVGPVGATLASADQGGDDSLDSDPDPGTGRLSVTLASGETDTTVDAGFWFAAVIGDRVWDDLDGDGAQDALEPGLDGVTVNLFASDGTTLVDSTVTVAGSYSFSVAPGSYVVDVDESTLTAGSALTTGNEPAPITVVSGDVVDTVDFGYRLPITIGDRVWADVSGDGLQDLGEPGLGGVTVNLFASDGTTLVDSTVTDGAGLYSFSVAPGAYVVDVDESTLPAGSIPTTGNEPASLTVVSGDVIDTVDFGYRVPAGVTLLKTALTPLLRVGGTATFEVTITNVGSTALVGLVVTDLLAPDCDRPAFGLAVGASITYTCTLTNVTADLVNVASVAGFDVLGTQVSSSDDAAVDVIDPGITITKTATPIQVVSGGDAVFSITVTNTGDVDLTAVTVTDLLAPDCDRPAFGLAVADSITYTCTLTNVTVDLTNSVSVQATPPVGPPVTASDTADVDVIHPSFTVSKTPDLQYLRSGDDALFVVEIVNTGDVDLFNVLLDDPNAVCDVTSIASLPVGDSESVNCTRAGVTVDFVNTVIVDAEDPNGDLVGPESDDASVDVIAPALDIDKTPANQVLLQGQTATFTITVSNTGDSTITGVTVTDSLAPDCARSLGALTAGQVVSYVCTVTGVLTGFVNVAGVAGTDLSLRPVTDTSPNAVVTVEVPVVVIDKTPDLQQVPFGGDAVFTIRVTNGGAVALFDITVTDGLTPDCDRAFATIPVGGFEQYTCSATGLLVDFTNTASVVAADAAGNPASDSDDADVDVIAPAISVTKTALTPTVYAGQTATFSVEVVNTGDVDLTDVAIFDLQANCATLSIPLLVVGESRTIACTTTAVAADFLNTVTVTADPPVGPEVRDSSSAGVLVLVPGVSISKTPDSQITGLNSTVTFSITVTNTGATPLTSIVVSDALSPLCDRTLPDLVSGGSATFTCDSGPVTADFTNMALVSAQDPAGNRVSDSDDAFVDLVDPAISVSKTPDLQTLLAGSTASFTITVTNGGDIDLTNVSVSDPLASDCDAAIPTLAAGASEVITCALTGVSADFTNIVTVSAANPLGGDPLTDSDDAVVDVVQPGVEIVKTATNPVVVAGGTAFFDITVTNTGDRDLVGLVVTDVRAPDCDQPAFDLAVGDSFTYSCSMVPTDDVTNIASVEGADSLGNRVSWSDDAAVDVIHPAFTVAKTPDTQAVVAGGTATFTITITNTGDVDLTNINLVDPNATCAVTSIASLAVGNSESVLCDTTGVMADFTNTVAVDAEDPNGDPVGPFSDSADVTVLTPGVGIAKTPNLQQVPTGGTVTFTITVTNTGETALTDVEVTDVLAPNCDRLFAALPLLGVETYTCTLSNVAADFTNVALVDALDPLGNPLPQASDDAVVDVIAPAITIAKTPDLQAIPLGDPVTFTIEVTNTGDVDLTDVTVTDPLASDCDRLVGDLAAGDSTSYTCVLDPVTASFVNTATVVADAPAGPQVTDTDTASVTVLVPGLTLTKDPSFQTLVLGSDVTFTITVTNTGQVALVDVDVADPLAPDCARADLALAVGATRTWTCTLVGPTTDFTNIATATGTDANDNVVTSSDSAVVDVVVPAIDISKTAVTPVVVSGQDGVFTITVTNIGQVDFVDVDVSDPALPACGRSDLTLAVGASASWTCTAPSLTANLVNTAVVTARTTGGVTVNDSSTATVTVVTVGDITGVLFFDLDGDGIYEPAGGDVPLVNVDVVIVGPSGTRVVSTDSSGRYEWIGILPGVYSVTVDQTDPDLQAGVFESTTSDGQSVNVVAGAATTAAPIGFTLLVPPTLPGPPTGSSTTVPGGTTTTTISPVTVPGTLPFTGFSLTLFLVAGLALIGTGGRLARRRDGDAESPRLDGWNG